MRYTSPTSSNARYSPLCDPSASGALRSSVSRASASASQARACVRSSKCGTSARHESACCTPLRDLTPSHGTVPSLTEVSRIPLLKFLADPTPSLCAQFTLVSTAWCGPMYLLYSSISLPFTGPYKKPANRSCAHYGARTEPMFRFNFHTSMISSGELVLRRHEIDEADSDKRCALPSDETILMR